jgi:hypothetical protein
MELYDVMSDPAESVDRLSDEPDVARRLERAAELYRDLAGYPNTADRTDLRNFRGGRVEWDLISPSRPMPEATVWLLSLASMTAMGRLGL